MQMQFSGEPVIPAPRLQVWDHLLDPHFVAASTRAVESVEIVDRTHYRVRSAIGVGPLKVGFDLAIELHDLVEPTSARMHAVGSAPGTTVTMDSAIRLEELGPEQVRLHWQATSTLDGAIAGLGGRLVEGVIRNLTEQFWQDFARRAGERTRPG